MSTNIQARPRLDFIDAERGIAVVLMLWLHTADGWLRPELKTGAGWALIRSVGGHAAPTFILLAGVSLGLTWVGSAHAVARSEIARGLQLIVLGYALRAQMWMIDAGGYRQLKGWLAAAPIAYGYAALYRAFSPHAQPAHAGRLFVRGVASSALGLGLVAWLVPTRFLPLLRVDVLQAIGASLVCVAALRPVLFRRPGLGFGIALAVALLTPALRLRMPGLLPVPIAAYIAAWETPAGQLAPTLFPLFPWLAYACVGVALGMRIRGADRAGHALRTALGLAMFGCVLALASCEVFGPAQRLIAIFPAATQLVRVAYRVGVALGLLLPAVVLSLPRLPLRGVVLSLGRASLFVYWWHLEFAFGALARPLAHRLDFSSWGFGFVTSVLLTGAVSALWLRIRARFSPRSRDHAASDPMRRPEPLASSGISARSP